MNAEGHGDVNHIIHIVSRLVYSRLMERKVVRPPYVQQEARARAKLVPDYCWEILFR
jgi:hypothetical protein